MDIWNSSKLFIFILFVVPGFLSMKAYNVFHPTVQIDTSKAIVEVVSYSCINHAIWFIPIYYFEGLGFKFSHPFIYFCFYMIVLIISPILLALIFSKARVLPWIKNLLPHPTGRSWDYYFGLRKTAWVVVTLKDGKTIGGYYGSDSFASSAPEPEQLYLEQSWHINSDGGFDSVKDKTQGVLILSKDIEKIEFYET